MNDHTLHLAAPVRGRLADGAGTGRGLRGAARTVHGLRGASADGGTREARHRRRASSCPPGRGAS
ncbi:hypothetical protein [Streptomyces atroolivaceus]|uniref:hypothetical protein n=1 Tax=Streptomyces atroolivaceus TaxID=66869 RepID=UPI003639DE1B